jgi:hypothetical protein
LKIKEPVRCPVINCIPQVIQKTLFAEIIPVKVPVEEKVEPKVETKVEQPKVVQKPVEEKKPEVDPEVKKIVDKLKEIFPQADNSTVVEMVNANKGMSFEELVLNYLGN